MNYKGNVAAPGIATGLVFLYQPFTPCFQRKQIAESESDKEQEKYQTAHEHAETELHHLITAMAQKNPHQAEIFEAHLSILNDKAIENKILIEIKEQNHSADCAIDAVYTEYIEQFRRMDNPTIAERAADWQDLRLRLLRCLEGKEEKSLLTLLEPVILVAHDLLPSDTATLNPALVSAIITEVGGVTSHSAIIAKSYGIPALTGLSDACHLMEAGELVIVDAIQGCLITQPTSAEQTDYAAKREAYLQRAEEAKRYLTTEAKTVTNKRIQVLANIGAADERELACASHVDGVGLFRTEFLYMGRDSLPDEEEQYRHYRRVLEKFAPKPVTLRTLDIGGDKEAACLNLPKEENPFLGNRALRLCFDRQEIFLTQLRAALRASAHGSLKLMFPMVGSLDDVRKAKELLQQAEKQLDAQGLPWDSAMKVGVMIEIPGIALMADLLAKEVDFASIGTNDLTQYLLAVDRINPAVTQYYQTYHPALMKLLHTIINAFLAAGKEISVCGEMAGNPLAATALLGMGIESLSMGASSVADIKKMISELNMDQAQCTVNSFVKMETAEQVEDALKQLLSLKKRKDLIQNCGTIGRDNETAEWDFEVTIKDLGGLHARPAAKLAKEAARFRSKLTISCKKLGKVGNAKHMPELLIMGLPQGSLVNIHGEGEDAIEAVDALVRLIDSNFS